jgi:hypothetical protein
MSKSNRRKEVLDAFLFCNKIRINLEAQGICKRLIKEVIQDAFKKITTDEDRAKLFYMSEMGKELSTFEEVLEPSIDYYFFDIEPLTEEEIYEDIKDNTIMYAFLSKVDEVHMDSWSHIDVKRVV